MRTLLILRGAPGSGKSTWVEQNGLLPYTLCPDTLRIMCSSRELQADGHFAVARNQATEKQTWKIVWDLLEYRMSRGEFTVIDATASKTKDIQQYKDIAKQYRYRMYVVDFTAVPLEVCLQQNKHRHPDKWVPEGSIRNIYSRFATQPVPAGVDVIKPDELYRVLEKPLDLSEYKKVVFIGDIHGCYDTLMQYPDFENGLDPETSYIFCGDFIDRGNQNAEVLKFLLSIMDKPNVCLLEGNHERWIDDYGHSVPTKSREFESKTRSQLVAANFTERDARMLYRKVRQMSHFMYNGIDVLACHAGIPCMKTNLMYIPTHAFVHGVGAYGDYKTIADTWMAETGENQFLVHGHRNVESDPVQIADRVFNLEGKVEFGGSLRIVELNQDLTWNVIELEDCQPVDENLITEERPVETIEEATAYLRNNAFVSEKKLGEGISSFNFTREAFYKANWNKQTILARGLFIDTEKNQIMARSYEKFFKINEVHETEMASLKKKLTFPVSAYVKENGFLAIVSYDYNKDDLFIASKSTNKGEYVEYIKAQIESYKEAILLYLRHAYIANKPVTLVFECVNVEKDPHIIKYNSNKLILLDAIYNTLDFKTVPYFELLRVAQIIECPVKERAFEIKDWEAFKNLYLEVQSEDYNYNDEYIEGFVFVDAAGFMTKCKTGYYNFWKYMRSVADQTLRAGYYSRTGSLLTPTANYFYKFCKQLFETDRDNKTKSYPYKTDIISLRDKFENKTEDIV